MDDIMKYVVRQAQKRLVAEGRGPYESLEEVQQEIRSVFDAMTSTRDRLNSTVKMLQASDEKMLANKTQKMSRSVEELLDKMEQSFPHLVSF